MKQYITLSWKIKKNYFIMRISLIYAIARNFYRPYDDAAPDRYYAEPKAVHRQALRVLKYWSHSHCVDYDATMCGGDGVNVDVDDLVHHYRSLLIHFHHPTIRAASDAGISPSRAARHHTIAGKLIALEHIQTAQISKAARLTVMRMGYENGSVIAQYRSNEITQRFNIDAVLNSTSNERQISHQSVPKNHVLSNTS
uniref:Uncharacterized protein n=1 Tax=Glossina palpalis gambiensis TaxID=67801 RepID=A0A1B0BU18_9MUSC